MSAVPGRLTRATVHCEAGEAELRLSAAGNWSLMLRGETDHDWRLACSGDLSVGVPVTTPCEERRRYGKLIIDLGSRSAFVDQREVELTRREFDLLAALSAAPARVFSKRELLRSIWGYDGYRTRTLDSHAIKLRVRLREAGADGHVICIKRVGYKLMETAELPTGTPGSARIGESAPLCESAPTGPAALSPRWLAMSPGDLPAQSLIPLSPNHERTAMKLKPATV